MTVPMILASGSEIRLTLLRNAGLECQAIPARVDEDAVRDAMLAEAAPPRDVADALAELKALKISNRYPDSMVIGCDQVLSFDGTILSKPDSRNQARAQLAAMRGKTHQLLSAVVICEAGRPVWRHVGVVTMTMRAISDSYLESYLDRNWDSIQHSVGGYKLEEEGVRLFTNIRGDYFTVLGLPLLDVISYLTQRGVLEQ